MDHIDAGRWRALLDAERDAADAMPQFLALQDSQTRLQTARAVLARFVANGVQGSVGGPLPRAAHAGERVHDAVMGSHGPDDVKKAFDSSVAELTARVEQAERGRSNVRRFSRAYRTKKARLGCGDPGGPFLPVLLELIAVPRPTFACLEGQTAMKIEAKSLEECLEEAVECERLARLARSKTARMTMKLSAAVWRKRAQEAAGQDQADGYWRSRGSAAGSIIFLSRTHAKVKRGVVGARADLPLIAEIHLARPGDGGAGQEARFIPP